MCDAQSKRDDKVLSSMDAHLDAWTQSIVTNAIYYALVTFNTVSRLWNFVSGSVKKSIAAILDAHREDIWLLPERNGTPWVIKNSSHSIYMLGNHRVFAYRPEKMLFQLIEYNPAQTEWPAPTETEGFTDVVLARIFKAESNESWDVSSFFHNIRWTSTAPPSLFEIATVCLLDIQVIVGRQELLEKFVLEVMTADGEDRRLLLDPLPFGGWPPAADDAVEEECDGDDSSTSLEEGEIREDAAGDEDAVGDEDAAGDEDAVGDEDAPAVALATAS